MPYIPAGGNGKVFIWIGEPFNEGRWVDREVVIPMSVGACAHPGHGKLYDFHVTKRGLTLQGKNGVRSHRTNEKPSE